MPLLPEYQIYRSPDSIRPFFGLRPTPRIDPNLAQRAAAFFSEYGPSLLNIRGAGGWISRFLDPRESEFDAFKYIPEGFEPFASAFALARDEEDVAEILYEIEQHLQNQAILEKTPFYEILPFGIATAMADPINWIIPGHVIYSAVRREGITRVLPTMARSAVGGMAANLPTELMLQASNPIRRWDESVADTLASGLFTALLGGYWAQRAKKKDMTDGDLLRKADALRKKVTEDLTEAVNSAHTFLYRAVSPDDIPYDKVDADYYRILRQQYANEIWGEMEEGMRYDPASNPLPYHPDALNEQATFYEGAERYSGNEWDEAGIQKASQTLRRSWFMAHMPEWFRDLVDDGAIMELRTWVLRGARKSMEERWLRQTMEEEAGTHYRRWQGVLKFLGVPMERSRAMAEWFGHLLPDSSTWKNLPQVYSQEFAELMRGITFHPQAQRLIRTVNFLEDKLDALIQKYRSYYLPGGEYPLPPSLKGSLTHQIKSVGRKIRQLRKQLLDLMESANAPRIEPDMLEYVKVSRMGMEFYVPRYVLFDDWVYYDRIHGRVDPFESVDPQTSTGRVINDPIPHQPAPGEEAAPAPPPKTQWVEPESESPPPNPPPVRKKAPKRKKKAAPVKPPEEAAPAKPSEEAAPVSPEVKSMLRPASPNDIEDMRNMLKNAGIGWVRVAKPGEVPQLTEGAKGGSAFRLSNGVIIYANSESFPHWMLTDALNQLRFPAREIENSTAGVIDPQGGFHPIAEIAQMHQGSGESPLSMHLLPEERKLVHPSEIVDLEYTANFVRSFLLTYGSESGNFPSRYIITRETFTDEGLALAMRENVLQEMVHHLKRRASEVNIHPDDVRLISVEGPQSGEGQRTHQFIEFGPIAIDPFHGLVSSFDPKIQIGIRPLYYWKKFLVEGSQEWNEWSPRVIEMHRSLLERNLAGSAGYEQIKKIIQQMLPLHRIIKGSETEFTSKTGSLFDPLDGSIFIKTAIDAPYFNSASWMHEYFHYVDLETVDFRGKTDFDKTGWLWDVEKTTHEETGGHEVFISLSSLGSPGISKDWGFINRQLSKYGKAALGQNPDIIRFINQPKEAMWEEVGRMFERFKHKQAAPSPEDQLSARLPDDIHLEDLLDLTQRASAGYYAVFSSLEKKDPWLFLQGFANLLSSMSRRLPNDLEEMCLGNIKDFFGSITRNDIGGGENYGHPVDYYANSQRATIVVRSASGKEILNEHPLVSRNQALEAFADFMEYRSIPTATLPELLLRVIGEAGMRTFAPRTFSYFTHIANSIAEGSLPKPYYRFQPE